MIISKKILRILTVLLALVMMLSVFVACDSNSSDDDDDEKSGSSSSEGSGSPEKAAEDFVVANLEFDFEKKLEVLPEFHLEYLAENVYDMEELDKDELLEIMEETITVDEKPEVEVLDSERENDRDGAKQSAKTVLKAIDMEDEMDNIDDYDFVTVTYEKDGEEGESTVLCIKMDGAWYVLN